jgi:peptidoglycan/xylan/chitin deacetylase (PgdA/CDA1 family)
VPKRPDNQRWRYWRTVAGVVAAAAVLLIGGLTGHVRLASADEVDCAQVKCVALTFDDGPSPYTDRLLQVLKDNDARATFFMIGNNTWEHPNMTAIPPEDIPAQLSKASDAITAATGKTPKLFRTAGGLINDDVLAAAKQQGLADINWDVIPFDWMNDSNTAATRYMLMTQVKPGSVVLFHDTYSSTVDLVSQFIPVLKANGYHMVTVTQMIGPRAPGTSYGSRENGPPANDITDIPAAQIPTLPSTPSPKPMPNFPITDIPGANSGGVNNGA